MKVKVLGTIEAESFNEIFELPANSNGATLRERVQDSCGKEVELFCMGRALSDQDTVPPGCVIHFRATNGPTIRQAERAIPSECSFRSSNRESKSSQSRDPNEVYEMLYDEEAGPDQVLRQNWNDPQVIAQYRARLEERGVDPEVAQRKLAETLKAIRKYQHATGFFFAVLMMELINWPLLTIDVVDLGQNEEKLLGGEIFNYKTVLTACWMFSILITLILLMGVCFGDQGEGCCLRFHRKLQWFFLLVNVCFFAISYWKLPPFGPLIAEGYWTALACHLIVECFFRVAKLCLSRNYERRYNALAPSEREYACGDALRVLLSEILMLQPDILGMQPVPQVQPGADQPQQGLDMV